MNILFTLGLFSLSLFAAGAVIWIARWTPPLAASNGAAKPMRATPGPEPVAETWLSFHNDALVSGSKAGMAKFNVTPERGMLLSDLAAELSQSFPRLAETLEALPETKDAVLTSHDGRQSLILEQNQDHLVIKLHEIAEAPQNDAPAAANPAETAALELELQSLRAAAHCAPCPIWRCGPEGDIIWANTAYLDLAAIAQPDRPVQSWPPIRLFPSLDDLDQPIRASVADRKGTAMWFSLHGQRVGGDVMLTAVPADAAVQAEQSLANFTQTLTKTFAHLPTGLAIFDRDRRLSLFNPALTELTTIRPDFLTGRPGLHAFLDKLRDKRMIPEPRDYRSWRHHIYSLEVEARNGTYDENWALPNGKTYKVTGQPHPNGAIAFMFEDISSEISMLRSHRSEIQLFQSVIDDMPNAVAVFSAAGRLLLANLAYRQQWHEPDATETCGETIVAATQRWAACCVPNPIWGDIRECVSTISERAEWTGEIRQKNGLLTQCRVSPLASGATLIEFATQTKTNGPKAEEPASHPFARQNGQISHR